MSSIISVCQSVEDLWLRLQGAERHQSRDQPRRDLRAAGAERRRQDHADQHHLRHRQSEPGQRDGRTATTSSRIYRAARSLIGLVPQELHTDAFESVWATVSFSRGLFGKPKNPAHIEKVLKDLSLWDKKDSKIVHAVRRHEAPGDDRQGAVARAADPVSRRADRGRRRRIAQGHVGSGADAAGLRRHHHPRPRITSKRPRRWPTGSASSTRARSSWSRTRPS